MKKVLKWIGVVLGGGAALLLVAAGAIFGLSNARINADYDIDVARVDIPTDEAALAHGKHVAIVRGCADCHGADFSGKTLIDDPAIGRIVPTNLTTGEGGVVGEYDDVDWVRAIRYGVGPDGKALIFMPSHEFYPLSEEDLGALIAYLQSVPPADNQPPEGRVGPVGRALFLAGQFDLIPAEKIDAAVPVPDAPETAVSVAYGEYMATGCVGCHGAGYSGGSIPGAPPSWPEVSNITPGGNLASWSEAQFVAVMRTGTTPEGQQLDAEFMPWPIYAEMTDVELQAIYAFLQSLPATETGNR